MNRDIFPYDKVSWYCTKVSIQVNTYKFLVFLTKWGSVQILVYLDAAYVTDKKVQV